MKLKGKNPQIKLIPFGQKTTNGEVVGIPFLTQLYSYMPREDERMLRRKYSADIESNIKDGISFFGIENERGDIVGATSANFEKPQGGKFLRALDLAESIGWIGNTFILPKFRKMGYAAASKFALEEIAKSKGITKIYSIVRRKNLANIASLKKAGFTKRLLPTADGMHKFVKKIGPR